MCQGLILNRKCYDIRADQLQVNVFTLIWESTFIKGYCIISVVWFIDFLVVNSKNIIVT